MGICVIAGCNNMALRGGVVCGLACGKAFLQINNSRKFETPTKPENDFGDITKEKLYYDHNDDIVELIKTAIVQYKILPQNQKALFLKNKIKPMVKHINGDTPKWNAVCKHLKSQYSEPQYRFIIDAFDSLGMRIYN